jgi:serine/threonine-protein kinase
MLGYLCRVLTAGDVVADRYVIEQRLAVGGMGAVYAARHLLSHKRVALKLLHAHLGIDAIATERFRREARASADIGHPGIVEVLDAGRDVDGTLFLAMELLEGESLRARLEREGTTRGEALALIDAMLDPLAAAHVRGFVHRDLKPENVFVEANGRVKLLDLGIAKELGDEGATLTGTALGTPHYMPPEQIMSSKGATPASDVWAAGAMIYEVIAGAPPFTGPTPHAVVVRACSLPHAPLADVAADVGPALAALVDRALDKDPRRRFVDASALRAALREALAQDPDASAVPVILRAAAVMPSPVGDTLPSRPPASTGGTAWPRATAHELSVAIPPGWGVRASAVPNVVLLLVDVATEHDDVPTQIRFKRDEWNGDTRSFADLGIEGMLRIGRLNRTSDTMFADLPAVEIDATYDQLDPPVRALNRCAVQGGIGWVAQASVRPDRFVDALPVLRALLGTVRLAA